MTSAYDSYAYCRAAAGEDSGIAEFGSCECSVCCGASLMWASCPECGYDGCPSLFECPFVCVRAMSGMYDSLVMTGYWYGMDSGLVILEDVCIGCDVETVVSEVVS